MLRPSDFSTRSSSFSPLCRTASIVLCCNQNIGNHNHDENADDDNSQVMHIHAEVWNRFELSYTSKCHPVIQCILTCLQPQRSSLGLVCLFITLNLYCYRIPTVSIDNPVHAPSWKVSRLLTPKCAQQLAWWGVHRFNSFKILFLKWMQLREETTTIRNNIHFWVDRVISHGLGSFDLVSLSCLTLHTRSSGSSKQCDTDDLFTKLPNPTISFRDEEGDGDRF